MRYDPEVRVRRPFWVLLGILAVSIIVLPFYFSKPDPPAALPKLKERSRKELEMKEGRWHEAEKLFSGIVFDQYEEGEMKSRSVVSNGLLEGLSEGWYTNGVKQVTEHFSKGVSNGLRTKYHPNGNKLSEAQIVNGQVEGLFQRWHDNGQLAEKVYLSRGVPDGESLAYHPDGSLKAKVRLDHGKVVEQQFWEPGQSR